MGAFCGAPRKKANNGNVDKIEQCEDMEIDPTPGLATTTTTITASPLQQQRAQQQEYLSDLLKSANDSTTCATTRTTAATTASNDFHLNSNNNNLHNSRGASPMNFDYIHGGLHESGSVSSSATASAVGNSASASVSTTRHYDSSSGQIVDDSRVLDRPVDLNERFVTVLDHLDAHVEKFRKDAMGLQEKRDYLLMSIDLIKSNDLLHTMSECERDEIFTYIQRVNSRLSTVELNVRTVRDRSQEDSLSQINALIDMMITLGDPVLSRQRCQQYLNACCSSAEAGGHLGEHYSEVNVFVQESYAGVMSADGMETDLGPVDKKFESVLLGCTLDDQKNIKKRLQALMDYLNKQTISH